MGLIREAAIPLTFEPEQVVCDPDGGLVRFFAADGLVPVQCGISLAALVALESDALAGPDAMVTAYGRHRELIQEIAERKYQARRFEVGGNVVVRLEDVPLRYRSSDRL